MSPQYAKLVNAAVVVERVGPPSEALGLRSMLRPAAGAGHVVVRLLARPVNPSDLLAIRGVYRHRTTIPYVAGYEGVGIVAEVGTGVAGLTQGDRVLMIGIRGTWQEFLRARPCKCVAVPAAISDPIAAQAYVNPVSAWIICHEILNLSQRDVVVLNAGGSAFAHVFIQLARRQQARVIALTGSPSVAERVRAFGADVLVTAGREYGAWPAGPAGPRATVALDAIGGVAGSFLATLVQPGGSFLHYGLLSGRALATSFETFAARRVRLHSFWLRQWIVEHSIERLRQIALRVLDEMVAHGLTIRPPTASYELEDVRDAVRAAESRDRQGKVLLVS